MSKKVFWPRVSIALAALGIIFFLFPTVNYADLPAGFQIWGPVLLDGKSAPPSSEVTAYIEGSKAGPWTAQVTHQGGTYTCWYGVVIPVDSGQGLDGGVNGQVVRFKVSINGQTYSDPNGEIWRPGANVEHAIVLTTPQISIATSTLPEATVGLPYTASLQANGGTAPYSWQVAGLPAGLSVSAEGIISGTPAASPQITNKETDLPLLLTVNDANNFQSQKTLILKLKWQSGDANGDGTIDMGDIIKVMRIYSGWDFPTPGADANGDGYINMLDVTYLLNIIMGP